MILLSAEVSDPQRKSEAWQMTKGEHMISESEVRIRYKTVFRVVRAKLPQLAFSICPGQAHRFQAGKRIGT
jgi:hypothetical protein